MGQVTTLAHCKPWRVSADMGDMHVVMMAKTEHEARNLACRLLGMGGDVVVEKIGREVRS